MFVYVWCLGTRLELAGGKALEISSLIPRSVVRFKVIFQKAILFILSSFLSLSLSAFMHSQEGSEREREEEEEVERTEVGIESGSRS